MVDKIGNFIGDKYREVAKGFMTVLKESKFYESGVLTPEEFVLAGDYLVTKCPTWKWSTTKQNISPSEYLPNDKQFLITTVSCQDRVKSFNDQEIKESIVESDWVETDMILNKNDKICNKFKNSQNTDCIDVDLGNMNINENKNQIVINNINEDYMNMDIEHIENNENKDDAFIVEIVDDDDNVLKSRTYDVTITYDFYYRVPRLWLIGYSEDGIPLSDNEVKEDIMLEYIDKTVTIEKHPCMGVKSISIHPCKHSMLIKKMISNFEKAGKTLEVEKSIILFLKFLSSVVPTIKYDFTLDIDF